MSTATTSLSTADARRETVVSSAIVIFAQTGYLGTPITAMARHAKISPAYVFKLFPSKEVLFVAALENCFERIRAALAGGADASADQTPDGILSAMGEAYAMLISNRSLLMLQVHAQSASTVPEIGDAFRKGLKNVTTFVKGRSGASDAEVQRFIACGQLCHLITTISLEDDTEPWTRILTAGIRHP